MAWNGKKNMKFVGNDYLFLTWKWLIVLPFATLFFRSCLSPRNINLVFRMFLAPFQYCNTYFGSPKRNTLTCNFVFFFLFLIIGTIFLIMIKPIIINGNKTLLLASYVFFVLVYVYICIVYFFCLNHVITWEYD